jgi:predicted GNAT superfamily acetyltransferase
MHGEIKPIRTVTAALLALNQDHVQELSSLDEQEFAAVLAEAFYASTINDADAFLIAFDQDAVYGSPNFRWFQERYDKFIYVDRVVTAPSARGLGYARQLYEDLFQQALSAGHRRIVCEVNLDPPNPASDGFHAALGFQEVGRAEIHGGTKTVRYLSRAAKF